MIALSVISFPAQFVADVVPPAFLFRSHVTLLEHDRGFVEDLGFPTELTSEKFLLQHDPVKISLPRESSVVQLIIVTCNRFSRILISIRGSSRV